MSAKADGRPAHEQGKMNLPYWIASDAQGPRDKKAKEN